MTLFYYITYIHFYFSYIVIKRSLWCLCIVIIKKNFQILIDVIIRHSLSQFNVNVMYVNLCVNINN